MIDDALVQRLADQLADAAQHGRPVEPLTARVPGLDLAGAYAVQRALVRRWTDAGDRLAGHKVGLTSAAMQQQLGADIPAGVPRDEIAAAVASVAVALEIIDSRIADWRIAVEDTVADNASSAYAVVGWPVPVDEVGDLRTVGLVLRRNGEVAATGAAAAVLGDPVLALAWLARHLAEQGDRLRAGQVVLPGAVHASVPLAPGDVVTATGFGLGSVSLRAATAAGEAA